MIALSLYDSVYVPQKAQQLLEWSQFCELFTEHQIMENKEDAILFNVTWMARSERISENAEGIFGMILDYDKGQSLEQAIATFSHRHLGYTSFKHGVDGLDRFRVVLPFTEPCLPEEWSRRRLDMLKWTNQVPGLDESCLSLVRAFYVPACPPSRADWSFTWNREGPLLDWRDFKEEPPYVPAKIEHRDLDDQNRQTLLDELQQCFLGYEPDWHTVGLAMASNGFGLDDFSYVTVGGMMNSKGYKECEKKWKHIQAEIAQGKRRSIGVLYNTIEKCLGHKSGSIKQQKYDAMIEKQMAKQAQQQKQQWSIQNGHNTKGNASGRY